MWLSQLQSKNTHESDRDKVKVDDMQFGSSRGKETQIQQNTGIKKGTIFRICRP